MIEISITAIAIGYSEMVSGFGPMILGTTLITMTVIGCFGEPAPLAEVIGGAGIMPA